MNKIVYDFVSFVKGHKDISDKEELTQLCKNRFNLIQDRKVFYCEYFAVRFCFSSSNGFSNTVLSLSSLQKYDRIPFFVILVKGNDDNLLFLSNATFLKKISHSSMGLTTTNIVGSFNGTDIMKTYNGIENNYDNFDKLFAYHEGLDWDDNLERLVETTSEIVPTLQRYEIKNEDNIYGSIDRSIKFIKSDNFDMLKDDLDTRADKIKDLIPLIAMIDNVNIRGKVIEILITSDEAEKAELIKHLKMMEQSLPIRDMKNGLGDYVKEFDNGETLTDVKTKIVYLDSNPKAYNIDKFLEAMDNDKSIFFIYFIGINDFEISNKILCSVYHKELLESTTTQEHWSGRSRRGTTQFIGKEINRMLNKDNFENNIDVIQSKEFLKKLINK